MPAMAAFKCYARTQWVYAIAEGFVEPPEQRGNPDRVDGIATKIHVGKVSVPRACDHSSSAPQSGNQDRGIGDFTV